GIEGVGLEAHDLGEIGDGVLPASAFGVPVSPVAVALRLVGVLPNGLVQPLWRLAGRRGEELAGLGAFRAEGGHRLPHERSEGAGRARWAGRAAAGAAPP